MNPCRSSANASDRGRGFTLVEMVVTIAILSILFLIMIGILDQSSRAWNQAEQDVDAFREGRAAQFVIDRDLENLTQPGNEPFFFLNRQNEEIQIGASLPPEAHGDSLFFTTLLPLNAQHAGNTSNLCVVGFYLAYTPDASNPGANRSYKLYRHLTSSDAAYSALKDFYAAGTTPVVSVIPRTVSGTIGDEVLARNIINFEVTPYRRNGSTGELEAVTDPWDPAERPAMVKVAFDAMNYTTAALLQRSEDWYDNPTFDQMFREKVQRFTTTVRTMEEQP